MPNLLQRLGVWLGLAPRYSLKDPALARLFGGGVTTLAGPRVSEATAFTCAAFWSGVSALSGDIAKLPLNLHRKRRDGRGSDVADDLKTHRLMRFSPNPETRAGVFRRTMTQHALVYGNGYAQIMRDGAGRPSALWVMHPNRVEPFYAGEPGPRIQQAAPLRYRIDGGPGNGGTVLEPSSVLHLRGMTDDAVSGINLVSVAREAIGLALASQQFAASFFGHGTRFGGVMHNAEQDVTEEQAAELRERIEALHARSDQAFRMLITGRGWEFKETGTNPTDAQMTELRNQQVEEIARFLDLPLYKLKLSKPGAVSYASVEMQALDYYKGALLTWITAWEEELVAKLIPSLEWGHFFFKHNVNAFLRGDLQSRTQALTTYRINGVLSANEIRDLEDMNPQEGPEGDAYLVQGAMVPAARLDDLVDRQVEPPPPPVLPSPESDEEPDERIATLTASLENAEEVLAEAQRDLDAAASAAESSEAEIQRLTEAVTAATGTAQAAQQALRHLETEQDALRQDVKASEVRTQAITDAHRRLLEDVVGRFVRLETDRARRKQATPEKLSAWLAGYRELQQDQYVTALMPSLRAVSAVLGVTDADVRDEAMHLVTAHLERFSETVGAAIEVDPGDFHAVLDRKLRAWEADQPARFAAEVLS